MATTTRAVLAAVTLALAIIPLGMLLSEAPPNSTVGTVLAVLAGVGGTATACLWVVKFPTKNQSIRAFTAVIIISARGFLADEGRSAEQVDEMQAAFTKSVMLHVTVWTRAYTANNQW